MSSMLLGSTTAPLKHLPTEDAFALLNKVGIKTIELGSGGYLDTTHLSPKALLRSGNVLQAFKDLLAKYDLKVSALSCCGNPVHPNKDIAEIHNQDFIDSCRLAVALGADTVVAMSGCPGDSASSKYPNFVSTAFPPDLCDVLEWQWERVIFPYWEKTARIAMSYGIRRIALEMMPGNCVYNPKTLLKLREVAGSSIGAALDPAHLIRQGIAPDISVKMLGGCIFQVHAKDLVMNNEVCADHGFFETDPNESPIAVRAFGNGHDTAYWKPFFSALKAIGYDRSVTLEYEDTSQTLEEGFPKAIKTVQKLIK